MLTEARLHEKRHTKVLTRRAGMAGRAQHKVDHKKAKIRWNREAYERHIADMRAESMKSQKLQATKVRVAKQTEPTQPGFFRRTMNKVFGRG